LRPRTLSRRRAPIGMARRALAPIALVVAHACAVPKSGSDRGPAAEDAADTSEVGVDGNVLADAAVAEAHD
jgi:hypothetical protein